MTQGSIANMLYRTMVRQMAYANKADADKRPAWWIHQELAKAKSRVDDFFKHVEEMLIRDVPETKGDIYRPREAA